MESNTTVSDTGTSTNPLTDPTLVDRAAQTAHEAIDRLAAKAGPALDRLRSAATNANDTLHTRADALGEMQEQWVESARSYVRANPIQAVALGVAAGLIISRLAR